MKNQLISVFIFLVTTASLRSLAGNVLTLWYEKSAAKWEQTLPIGKAGQLMEWNGDWDMNSRDLHHRHVSHFYFHCFPGIRPQRRVPPS